MAKTPIFRARRMRRKSVGWSHSRLIQGNDIASSPYASPILLSSGLDTSIDLDQIKQLMQVGYIHSTIVGFNQDYLEYSHTQNILNVGKQYREKGKQDLEEALNILEHNADVFTKPIWGDPIPGVPPQTTKNGIPTLDHLSRANYALFHSPTALSSQEWLHAYGAWQIAFGQYRHKTGKNVEEEPTFRDELTSVVSTVQNAARELFSKIQEYDNIEHSYIPPDEKENDPARKKAQTVLNRVIQFNLSKKDISSFNKDLLALASYFGYRTESLRSYDILNEISAADVKTNLEQGNFVLKRTKTKGVSDIEFELKTTVPKASDTHLAAGISYKLRTFGNFTLSATFELSNTEDMNLQYLFYLYRNILALTEFASDKMVGRNKNNKRVLSSNRAKYNNLLVGLGDARTSIVDFNTYITYRLLLTAFFGNRYDAESSQPLDPDYLEQLKTGYNQTGGTPPSFVMTGQHVYKTADILRHYLEMDQRTKEWKNLNSFQSYFAGRGWYRDLQKLWDDKRDILTTANEEDPTQNVYDILLHSKLYNTRKVRTKLSFYREVTVKL